MPWLGSALRCAVPTRWIARSASSRLKPAHLRVTALRAALGPKADPNDREARFRTGRADLTDAEPFSASSRFGRHAGMPATLGWRRLSVPWTSTGDAVPPISKIAV